jgi:hypothetical protein
MKLDRNTNPDGRGKYALIKLRGLSEIGYQRLAANPTDTVPVPNNLVDFGTTPDTEFFVIRLKDKNAANALMAYAVSCKQDDPEFSNEVHALALRAAKYQPKQRPT